MVIYEKENKYYLFDSVSKKLEWFIEISEVKTFDKYHTYMIFEIDGKFYSGILSKNNNMPDLELDETYTEIQSVAQKYGHDFEILKKKVKEVKEMTIFDFLE